MKTLMVATLSSALLAAVATAHAGGKVGIDPGVPQLSKNQQNSAAAIGSKRSAAAAAQRSGKPGAAIAGRAVQRQGLQGNGTDLQGTDFQGTDFQGVDGQGVDAQGMDPQGVDAQGTDAQGVDARGVDVQATQSPAPLSHQLDTLSLQGEPLVDVRLVEGELTARTALQVSLPGQ